MSSSRILSPLYLLSFSLLLQLTLSANSIYHFCSTSENFTPKGPYAKNLNMTISYLQSSTPKTGFSFGSGSLNQTKVYGLAQCRGDINITTCQACVNEASSEIQQTCPISKSAIIYYDYCQLKYANLDFFGQIDNNDWVYLRNNQNVSDPVAFNKNVTELFDKLDEEAYNSKKMYATGEMEIGGSNNLYGLVQCTRDLSSVDCKVCIDGIISVIPRYLYGTEGGRFMGGSCGVRFEIYPFFNA